MSKIILFITDIGSPWGGSEELWSQTAERLIDLKYNISASVGYFTQIHRKTKNLEKKGCKVLIRKNKIRLFLPKLKDKINFFHFLPITSSTQHHIKKTQPDLVIFSQSSSFSMYEDMLYCARKNIKYLSLTQLNSEYSWPSDTNYKLIRSAFKNALQNYFVSQGNLNLFQTQIALKLENVSVTSNPFNFKSIVDVPWPSEDIFQMAYVGRIDFPHKGIDTLITCFSDPKWADRNMQLNIYGSGNKELAQELTKHLGATKIIFHGHVDGIIKLWKANHILVMASRYEGMPLSILEAMYCQRPIIATPVAGHGEYITHLENGFLSKGTSVELFSDTIEEAWELRNKWREFGQSAFRRVKNLSSEDPVGSFTNEVISYLN